MKNVDLLKNEGFFRIGNRQTDSEGKTIIVLGLARSGTSIVAGALSHLGVYMGDRAGRPVFEDVHLSSAVESNDPERIESIIEEYNNSYKIWGYKRPASLNKLSLLHHKCRNPHYIIMFRDIFSIANRNRISVKSDILKNMDSSLHEYKIIIKFISQKSPNVLLVAFDKALNDKERLIEHLVSFCGIKPNSGCIEAAKDFITPDPEDYLESSRITRSKGMIENVTSESVTGWARYQNDERPANVCLMADDKKIAQRTADIFSQHLIDENIHSTGTCGFVFDNLPIDWNQGIKEIRVKVDDDVHDLTNSPFIILPPDRTGQYGRQAVTAPKEMVNKKQAESQIRKIYLHVGLHKTGTTSIQNALYENRALLQKNNMHYPQKWIRNHSIPLYLLFCDQNRRYNYHICVKKGLSRSEIDANRKEYRDILLEAFALANFETLILSGEDVSILTRENLTELKAFFQSAAPGAQVKIIVSLREPIQMITSRIQERIKSGQSISDKLFVEVGKPGFRKTIEKFHRVFGEQNVIIYKFEDALAHDQGLVGFFMELIGLKKKDFPKFKKQKSNKSLSHKAVDIISYINAKQPLIRNGAISEGRRNGDTNPLHKIKGKKFQLYQSQTVQKIIGQSKDELAWLKLNTGIDYPMDILGGGDHQDIEYSAVFFDDIKTVYPVLSIFIKKHVHGYIKMREATVENKESKKTLVNILKWIDAYNLPPGYPTQYKTAGFRLIAGLKSIGHYLLKKLKRFF